ncbi:hypothetical protein EBR04_00655 [bacterium]|nr:hypothetical protein [bacterium]
MRSLIVIAIVLVIGVGADAGDAGLERHDDRVDVTIDGKPFTSYVFTGHRKPILFPILSPAGTGLTRQWPMMKGVAGEPHDHPHHESLWFMHGKVNGIDFWLSHPEAEKPDHRTGPRVEQTKLETSGPGRPAVIETENRWVKADGDVVCTDSRRLEFAGDDRARTIDFVITIRADHGPVTFGDTKEGMMALRVHPALQLKNAHGSQGAAGRITDSEGRTDAAVWGKAARWVDYSGPVEGLVQGVAIFDHPANLRHPAHWHARDYGLVAANPFGLHDFTGAPAGTGDHTIPAGESLTLRYRFVVHLGDAAAAAIEDRWKNWAAASKHPE